MAPYIVVAYVSPCIFVDVNGILSDFGEDFSKINGYNLQTGYRFYFTTRKYDAPMGLYTSLHFSYNDVKFRYKSKPDNNYFEAKNITIN